MLGYGLLLYPFKELYAPTGLILQVVLSASKAAFGAMIGGPLTVFFEKISGRSCSRGQMSEIV